MGTSCEFIQQTCGIQHDGKTKKFLVIALWLKKLILIGYNGNWSQQNADVSSKIWEIRWYTGNMWEIDYERWGFNQQP